jgi:flagellar hook-associated protein 2
MRVGGLASGMDIDSIVADLMKAERIPLDKLKQEKQTLEWKRDQYREMNTLLLDFRSELTQMKLTNNYRARTTTSSSEDKVTATASGAASQGSYNIEGVSQLASAATLINNSGGISADNKKIDATKGIYSQDQDDIFAGSLTWKQGVVESKNVSLKKDGEDIFLETTVKDAPDSVSIKVNGKGMKVVTGTTELTDVSSLEEGTVYLNTSTGKLQFKEPLKKEDVVEVEYVVDRKKEEKDVTDKLESWQLSRGSIYTDDFSLTVTTTDETGTTYKIGGEIEGTNEFQLVNEGDANDVIGTINAETGKITFLEPESLKDKHLEVNYTQNYTSFELGAHTSEGKTYENFIIQGNQSLNSVMNDINASKVGVTMFYDSFSDQVTLTRTESGNFNGKDSSDTDYVGNGANVDNRKNDREIIIYDDFMKSMLKFDDGSVETGGENAVFKINGLKTERNSNTFSMNGVTFTLKQEFNETLEADSNSNVGISINNDSNQVFENIKGFVEKYNELIDKIKDKTSETYYRDYGPLTEMQREELSDKQQEKWEEMAKSGLLRRDSILTGALSQMRSDFYGVVNNPDVSPMFNQLASIGIKTTANYLEGGKLEIDEKKLKEAIEADPESVENLFRGSGDTYEEKGIVQRLYDSVTLVKEKLDDKAGNAFSTNQSFSIGKELTSVDKSIDRFEDRMKQVEDRYWRQFTAMEKAIQQANSQSAYLMQQFSGM